MHGQSWMLWDAGRDMPRRGVILLEDDRTGDSSVACKACDDCLSSHESVLRCTDGPFSMSRVIGQLGRVLLGCLLTAIDEKGRCRGMSTRDPVERKQSTSASRSSRPPSRLQVAVICVAGFRRISNFRSSPAEREMRTNPGRV